MRHHLFVFAICILTAAPLAAAVPDGVFEPGDMVRVVSITDGRTLELEDGRTVRLAGIDAPPFNGPHAAIFLRQTIKDQDVRLWLSQVRTDRWGRVPAHMETPDGTWLQEDLLRRGLARVQTSADTAAGVAEMLAAEAEARAARRGLWAEDRFRVRTPDDVGQVLQSFQIVEGRVHAAARVRGRVFLNFSGNWKTDFTVLISSEARRGFEREGIDLQALGGRTVRVRGWVREWNGPLIELSHAAQLEILIEGEAADE